MNLFGWIIDAAQDVIDMYFTHTDIPDGIDINNDQDEWALHASYDVSCGSYHVENHHVFDESGNDLGPVGKFVG